MSKYIIELNNDVQIVQKVGVTSNGNAFSIGIYKDILEQYTPVDIEKIYDKACTDGYNRGLEDGKKAAVGAAELREKLEYQKGLDDAWECAKKLFSTMSDTEIEKVFPTEWENGFHGLMQMKPQYAIEKLKSYKDDKIKRGDIVNVEGCCDDNFLGVVTKVWEDNCYIMWGDGSGGAWSKDSVVKTGRHFDIDKILDEMKGNNDK